MAEEDDREVKKVNPWYLSRFLWYRLIIYSIVFGVIYILTKKEDEVIDLPELEIVVEES